MAAIAEREIDLIELICGSCGTRGWLSRRVGDLDDRLTTFVQAHRQPMIVKAKLVDHRGAEVGWWLPGPIRR